MPNQQETITVYASFRKARTSSQSNGQSNGQSCILVSGMPWPMECPYDVVEMTIPYEALYIDFDGEVTALPCEYLAEGAEVAMLVETRYCDAIPLEWLTEDDDWVGGYIKDFTVVKDIKWRSTND